jgi:hypothetical protein
MKLVRLLFSILLLAGCSQEDLLQKFSSSEDQAEAKGYIAQLSNHEYEAIERAADPSIKNASLHQTLEGMAALIPSEPPKSVKLVGAHTFHASDTTTVNTTFEYEFSGKWLLINVAIQQKGDSRTLVGFHVIPRSQSLEVENKFSLAGKNAIQYIVLGLAVIAPGLTLYALVACIRTKVLGRKWLWILFILFGFGKFSVNWTTGQWGTQLLAFQLFSAGAFAQLYGPWIVSVSVPLGAILFLVRRGQFVAQTAAPAQQVATVDPPTVDSQPRSGS